MRRLAISGVVLVLSIAGCVSKGAHTQTLIKLEALRKASAQTTPL